MRVKYLFIDLKYPAYIKLQIFLVVGWLLGAVLCFMFAKESAGWFVKNGWWLCLTIAVLESFESIGAIYKAKENYNANS